LASSSVRSRNAVVETDFGVEANELAGFGDDQRIDFEEIHVLGQEGLIKLGQHGLGLFGQLAAKSESAGDLPGMMGHETGRRIDREREDLLRPRARNLLDFHAAFGRGDEGDARGRAIDERGKVIFAVDVRAVLDVKAMHFLAVRPGLVRHQRRTEQALGFALHVGPRLDHFHAAGLAAAAGVDLGLDHPDRPAEVVRGLHRLLDAQRRNAARHRHAEFPEHGLRLIFVDVHALCSRIPDAAPGNGKVGPSVHHLPRSGAIFLQASTRPSTAAADFSNMPRSAPLSSISTMRSTPLAPMTTGTPT